MTQQPNIVLISLDAVRADHLPMYGYGRPTAPFFQELSRQGSLFERAYSAANWTLPSHTSMITGAYPSRHAVGSAETGVMKLANPWLVTLAEFLQGMGYKTLGITNAGFLSRASNFQRGFQDFWFIEDTIQEHDPLLDIRVLGKYPARFVNRLMYRRFHWKTDKGAARSSRVLERWLSHRRQPGQPSFIFMHLFDAHAPYWPPKGWRSRYRPVSNRDGAVAEAYKSPWNHMLNPEATTPEIQSLLVDLYDAGLNYVDHVLEHIVGLVDRHLGVDNTLLIVTADHGDALGEDGFVGHGGDTLRNSVIHVPLVARYPLMFLTGTRTPHPVSSVDIFPTVADALGISDERLNSQLDGISLKQAGKQDRLVVTESLVPPYPHLAPLANGRDLSEFQRVLRSAVWENWKFLTSTPERTHAENGQEVGVRIEGFYDLEADPQEQNNLALGGHWAMGEAARRLQGWLDSVEPMLPPRLEMNMGYDAEITRRLQALGYLE